MEATEPFRLRHTGDVWGIFLPKSLKIVEHTCFTRLTLFHLQVLSFKQERQTSRAGRHVAMLALFHYLFEIKCARKSASGVLVMRTHYKNAKNAKNATKCPAQISMPSSSPLSVYLSHGPYFGKRQYH